jgi:hypothetical protein
MEQALGMGSKAHNEERWAEDNVLDRRAQRILIDAWGGLRDNEILQGENAVIAAGEVSPDIRRIMERMVAQETRTQGVDEVNEVGTPKIPEAYGSGKTILQGSFPQGEAGEESKAKRYAELRKTIKTEEELMKEYLRREIDWSRACARKVCQLAHVAYEEYDISQVRQNYVVEQKKQIKFQIMKTPTWRWSPSFNKPDGKDVRRELWEEMRMARL